MNTILIARAINKDTLEFNGIYNNKEISQVLISNKTFEENKRYILQLEDIQQEGSCIIANASKTKELDSIDIMRLSQYDK